MKVSIVLPTLNEEKNIGHAIRSLKHQTYKGEYEIIVADSNSGDRTEEIAKKAGAKVYNFGQPHGAGAARDSGARKSKGELILFMDADSFAHPDWLKEFVALFESDPKIVVASGKIYPREKGNLVAELYCRYVLDWVMRFMAFIRLPMAYGINMAVRRAAYRKVGGFNTKLITCEDTDLTRRMQKYGKVGYAAGAIVHTSTRRARKMGAVKYAFFHFLNHFRYYLFGMPSRDYAPVRK